MAYYLDVLGNTSRLATLGSAVSSSSPNDWRWVFDIKLTGTDIPILGVEPSNGAFLFFLKQTTFEWRHSSTQVFTLNTNALNARTIIEIVGSNNKVEIFQDGISLGARSEQVDNLFAGKTLFPFGNSSRSCELYGAKFYDQDLLIHSLDPSASNGTGSTLIDTVGGNNGTLVNFPTDDNQWVYYSTGSTEDALTAQNLQTQTSTTTPTLTQAHQLAPASLQAATSTTTASLSDQSTVDNLTATGLQAGTSTTSPTFTQAHNLTASNTASQATTSTPTLAQVHTLTSQCLTASTSTTTATLQSIAGQDSLAATDLTASTSTTTGTLAQIHTLTPQSLAAGTSTTTASIAQVHGLAASNVVSITSTTSPILRNASVVLATPINNTRATAIQTTYKATTVQAQRKAVTIQADCKVGVA